MRREGEVILIYHEDKPSVYARIESIKNDVKKDWYQITLMLLTIPPQSVTWILREEYIDGAPFTMGGVPMVLGEVESSQPVTKENDPATDMKKSASRKPGTVIPFKRS
jgi:hypothetical protein